MTKRNDRRSGYRCSVAHREANGRYFLTRAGREARRDERMRREVKRGEDRIEALQAEYLDLWDCGI
jgi:hypothetical protein